MELIEIVKKRLEDKGWDFSSDYWDDEELTSLHEVILETKEALRQPPVSGSLPSEEDIFQWAVKKSELFERNLLARQCFIEGAEYMRKCVERGNDR